MLRSEDGDGEDEDEKDDAQYDRLVDRGAVELIVTVMERLPLRPLVQEQGCVLLSRLGGGAGDLRDRCCFLIVSVMETHLGTPEV